MKRRFFPSKTTQQVPGRVVEFGTQVRPEVEIPEPVVESECPPPALGWRVPPGEWDDDWFAYPYAGPPYATWHDHNIDVYETAWYSEVYVKYGLTTDGAPINWETDSIRVEFSDNFRPSGRPAVVGFSDPDVDCLLDLKPFVDGIEDDGGQSWDDSIDESAYIVLSRNDVDIGYLTIRLYDDDFYPTLNLGKWKEGSPP